MSRGYSKLAFLLHESLPYRNLGPGLSLKVNDMSASGNRQGHRVVNKISGSMPYKGVKS